MVGRFGLSSSTSSFDSCFRTGVYVVGSFLFIKEFARDFFFGDDVSWVLIRDRDFCFTTLDV